MKRTKLVVSVLLVAIVVLSMFGTGYCKPKEQVLKLGLVSPLTGTGAASGSVQQNAAKMAVNEINAQGGIRTKNGRVKIDLISEDDEGSPAKSVTVTQKLVSQDKIHVMIGALNSSCTLADMEITSRAHIPQIAPSSTAVSITQQGNKYIFRNATKDATHVDTIFKYLTQKKKVKKIAVLYESSDFGVGAEKLIQNKAKETGVTIAASERYNTGDKDFSVQLTKIKATNPDAILIWGYYSEVALICKQVIQYDIKAPLIGTGYNSPKLFELGGTATNGLMFSTPFSAANPAKNVQKFLAKYNNLYHQDPDQNAAQVYDAVYMVAKAVESVGVDSEKIRDYLAKIKNFPGVAGVTSFDQYGDVVKDIAIVKLVNGKHELVK